MSKSLDNYIGLSDSPEVMYEKSMKIPDNVLNDYFRLTTDLSKEEIDKIMNGDIIEAHRIYAKEIIKMYHGEHFFKKAEERYQTVANGGVPSNIEIIELDRDKVNGGYDVLTVLVDTKLLSSKSEARRLVEQNGIKFNGVKMDDTKHILSEEDFLNDELVIQKGKKQFIKLILKN